MARKSRSIIRVICGFLGASLTAGLSTAIQLAAIVIVAARLNTSPPDWIELLLMVLVVTPYASILITALALVPAVVFIMWSESRSERRIAVHIGGGVLINLIGAAIAMAFMGPLTAASITGLSLAFALPAIFAGVAYWIVSGRYAGS